MIRKLLITTAAAALMAGGAIAQTADPAAPANPTPPATEAPAMEKPVVKADGQLASNLIGETVYNGTGDNAENIGDVNDLLIGANGTVDQLVIGVGGFLGIGEKDVAIDYKTAEWAEKNGDRWLVVGMSKEELEAAPAFDRAPYEPAAAVATAPAAPATTDTAMQPAPAAPAATDAAQAPATPPADTAQAPAATTETTAQAPAATDPAAPKADAATTAAIDKSTLTAVPATEISADNLKGTTVYGADDANIGEIGDVVLTGDKVDAVIIDVGGFLGMGEKPVAVGMDNLAFMADKDGNRYLYTTFTKEQLEAAPAYDAATFAEKRDEQILKMTQ
jgi:sporulation protein YlmC with PRC-barrel domain